MAWADLSEDAKEGLNYAAGLGTSLGRFATGKEYMDALAEHEGQDWVVRKRETRRLRRLEKLDRPENAALVAQLDQQAD